MSDQIIPDYITYRHPLAQKMKLIDSDGTDLTKTLCIIAWDNVTKEAVCKDVERTHFSIRVRNEVLQIKKFPNAIICLP